MCSREARCAAARPSVETAKIPRPRQRRLCFNTHIVPQIYDKSNTYTLVNVKKPPKIPPPHKNTEQPPYQGKHPPPSPPNRRNQ